MTTKGTIPFVEQEYDLKDPSKTAKSFVAGVIGIAMLFAATGVAQTVYNRASRTTDAVQKAEVF